MSAHAGITLFLDTPRASGGLNHRFLVASAAADEKRIVRYAQAARSAVMGADYLAVSRPAEQVSEGQTRTGLELLVLAGISTIDPAVTMILRARLEEMLRSLPDAPVAAVGAVHGLLIESREMAGFEQELRARAMPSEPPSSSRAWPRRLVRNALLIGIPVMVILVAAARKREHRGKVAPVGEAENTSIFQHQAGAPQPWSFLDEPGWSKLAMLTGLPAGASAEALTSWAARLLKEADPDGTASAVTPEEVKQNAQVQGLLGAVQIGGDNAEAISRAWLARFPENEKKALLDFWKGLEGSKVGSPHQLKTVLVKWERAIGELAQSKAHATEALRDELNALKIIPAPAPDALPPVQILLEADRRRFERVKTFLNSETFIDALAKSGYGSAWKTSDWEPRLMQLPKLSTDHNPEFPEEIRQLCEKLSAAIRP